MNTSVFDKLIWCAPLAQRASYLAQHSSLFGPDDTVYYDYIVTNSFVNRLKVYSQWRTLLSQFGPCFKSYQKL